MERSIMDRHARYDLNVSCFLLLVDAELMLMVDDDDIDAEC